MAVILRLACVLFLALAPTSFASKPDGFKVVLSTAMRTRYGANVQFNVGSVTRQGLPSLFDRFRTKDGRTLLPSSTSPMEVVIVVPKGASLEMRAQYEKEIEAAVRPHYPKMSIVFQESFVDLDESDRELTRTQDELAAFDATLSPDSHDHALVTQVQNDINRSLEGNEALRQQWFQKSFPGRVLQWVNHTHPYNTLIAAQVIATAKFTTSMTVVLSRYGFSLSSFLIGVVNGGISAVFGYSAKPWSHFCTAHTLPLLRNLAIVKPFREPESTRVDSDPEAPHKGWVRKALSSVARGARRAMGYALWKSAPIIDPPIALYNRNGTFKSATVNFFRSLGISYLMRLLAYETGQTLISKEPGSERVPVATPNSIEFLTAGLGLTLPEVWLDGLEDDGARALEQKRILNHQSRSYLLWLVGIIDTTMQAAFRAGAVEMAYTVAVVSWATKIAIWATGRFLPDAGPQIVFISESVGAHPTATLKENKSNFLRYLLGFGVFQATLNRIQGKFSISDQEMVFQDRSLEEAWNLDLSEAQMHRLNSPDLTQDELRKFLNLSDTDQRVLDDLWNLQQQQVGFVDATDLCVKALAR